MTIKDFQNNGAFSRAGGASNTSRRSGIRSLRRCAMVALIFSLAFSFGTATRAQAPNETTGKTAGNYNVSESVEFGYRDSMIGGNLNNYNTFENLNSGVRLFDYTMNMRSINHQGILFDNLSFSNFGYGGDPNDVSRLRVEKNKWYDFRALYRRDKDIWNYNLMANPLNPTTFNPPMAIANSPHGLFLSRRMQDYDLTVLPQSQIRLRLGYSYNVDSRTCLHRRSRGERTRFCCKL